MRFWPSVTSSRALMFTTRSTSGNSKRCGVSASRSFGPMSGSLLRRPKVRSMTSRNSLDDLKPIPKPTLHERRAALNEVFVDQLLDGVAHALGDLEQERAV